MDISGKVNLKTLIVEDNATFRGLLRDSLQSLFPTMMIQEATEGNEALQRVDTFRPELIFMDIRLPGENGLQLTHRIKTNYPDTKVIILTAYDVPEYREAATRCGASCFLAKDSLNLGQVETLVKSVLSGLNKPY
jgi:DNA-binding NarL/FixJ family response regulator